MLKRLRELIRGEESDEDQQTVSLDEVDGLLDRWTAAITGELEERTAGDREVIRDTVAALASQVEALTPAEPEEEVHPKLAQVTRVSLPAFQKAMDAALAHTLGTDPTLFYTEAADLLKSAIRAQQGQGRYLRAVLPDEMDGIKASIAEIGRAINRMTAVFAEINPRCDQIEEARGLCRRLVAAGKSADALRTLAAEERTRGEDLRRKATEADEERVILEGSAAFLEYRALVDRLRSEAERKDAARARGRAVATTAAHFLRRAGKVAGVEKTRRDLFSAAEERLNDLHLTDPAVLSALDEAATLVREGNLALKNQEERTLFLKDGEAERILAEAEGGIRETAAAVEGTEAAIAASTAGIRHQDLEKQSRLSLRQAQAADQSAADEEERAKAAAAEVDAARKALTALLTTLGGHPVTLIQ